MEEVKSGFTKHLYPVIAGLTIVTAAFALAVYGSGLAVGILAGGAFAIINTTLIGNLIRATLSDVRITRDIILIFLLKFPLIYGILIFLLSRHLIDKAGFLIGFTMLTVGLLTSLAVDYYVKNRKFAGSVRGNEKL
ncbi:hypothetical protein KAU08_05250 [bacterium]|nr:hypothetical protein [bacterium]